MALQSPVDKHPQPDTLNAMRQRRLLYLETSIFGFYFDPEPRNALRRDAVVTLFTQIRAGILDAFTSPVTFGELNRALGPRREDLLTLVAEIKTPNLEQTEVDALAEAYLSAKVIPLEFANDAVHVACATLGRADVLVSLNLRHLANAWAERRIAGVSLQQGYQAIAIRMPEEVLEYED
jgi:predicted nucleic acid-binding protein